MRQGWLGEGVERLIYVLIDLLSEFETKVELSGRFFSELSL
jgi:hypothetical protein